ncbi:unnamed protein product [Musa hybrid cultivar]
MQTNHHHHPSILPIFHTVCSGRESFGGMQICLVLMTGNRQTTQHLIIKSLFLCLFGAVTAAGSGGHLVGLLSNPAMMIRLESAGMLHFYPHRPFVLWPSLLSASMTYNFLSF